MSQDNTAATLAEWLLKEMPPGAIVSDPRWWAKRIAAHLERTGQSVTNDAAHLGWKACQRQVFALSEDFINRHPQNSTDFDRGVYYAAKQFGKAFSAFGPDDCDELRKALDAATLPEAATAEATSGADQVKPAVGRENLSPGNAPEGTRAPAIMGGAWCKMENGGWKWNGPDGCGGTFPNPGGDWTGELIAPDLPHSLRTAETAGKAPASVPSDTVRLAWIADGWTPGHEVEYVQHVLTRGGTGDLDDMRTFIDLQMGRDAALAAQPSPERNDCEPVATLHDDGYYTFKRGKEPQGARYAGWRLDVYTAPQPPAERHYCERCKGSGEDPEGYFDQSRGPDGGTHDGPCRDCDGSGKRLGSTLGVHTCTPPEDGGTASVMRRCATIAAIHSMYPVETEWERGYGAGRKAAADAIHAAATNTPEGGA